MLTTVIHRDDLYIVLRKLVAPYKPSLPETPRLRSRRQGERMRKTLIATVALLLAAPALAGSPTPRLPHLYAWAWCVGGPRPYFECDYPSRTCLQGPIFGMRGGFVGVVLAEDRHTVLAHLWCTDPHLCIDLDTGEGFADNRHVPQLDRQ